MVKTSTDLNKKTKKTDLRKTVIVGLGNPILTDDSDGINIARKLKGFFGNESSVDVLEVYAGGIRLIDVLEGYERAVIIDAIVTGKEMPGTIFRLSLSDLPSTRNTLSVHDMDLPTALELGKTLGLCLPHDITIWAIEAGDVETFSENLTEDVEKAVPFVVENILKDFNSDLRGRQ